jgi:hypothetical protein
MIGANLLGREWDMTTKIKHGLMLVFAMMALTIMQSSHAADVTGTWIMTVQTSAGSGSPTFTLVQKGDAISGTLSGNDMMLEFSIDAQGQSLTIKYTGKVDGKTVSGNVALGAFGSGTFTGTKQ